MVLLKVCARDAECERTSEIAMDEYSNIQILGKLRVQTCGSGRSEDGPQISISLWYVLQL